METSPLSHNFTRRFIAGETLDEALAVCQRLEGQKIWTTLDHLGEMSLRSTKPPSPATPISLP